MKKVQKGNKEPEKKHSNALSQYIQFQGHQQQPEECSMASQSNIVFHVDQYLNYVLTVCFTRKGSLEDLLNLHSKKHKIC